MALPILAVLKGLGAVKQIADVFKNKHGKNTDKVTAALDTITEFTEATAAHPDAEKILKDHELELEKQYTLRAQAALDVIKAEVTSEDAWVRRARPMWLYVGMLVFLAHMIVFPFCSIKITDFIDLQALNWFYSLIGAGYLGYGALRSYDKTIIGKKA